MEIDNNLNQLKIAISNFEQEQAESLVNGLLNNGVAPMDIVDQLRAGVKDIGERFSKGELFISELILCGEMLKNIFNIMEPYLTGNIGNKAGTIVIGTVKGDIHDLGKNLVCMLLRGSGYEVIDLGVDVHPEKFVESIENSEAKLVGLSVVLTSCQNSLKETVEAIKKAGLPDVKIMIGGNYVNEQVKEFCGADFFGDKADAAVKVANTVFN